MIKMMKLICVIMMVMVVVLLSANYFIEMDALVCLLGDVVGVLQEDEPLFPLVIVHLVVGQAKEVLPVHL